MRSSRLSATALVAFAAAMFPAGLQAQTCTETENTYTENFTTTTYKDATSTVDGWPNLSKAILRRKGNSFSGASTTIPGTNIYVEAAGDFDNDGWNDMEIAANADFCHLRFLKSSHPSGVFSGFTLPAACSVTISGATCSLGRTPTLVSGDFNGDGHKDLIYLQAQNESTDGTVVFAALFRWTGVDGNGCPTFVQKDILSDLTAPSGTTRVSYHWTGTQSVALDWNKDGRDDFLIVTSYGNTNKVLLYLAQTNTVGFQAPITLLANAGLKTPIADSQTAGDCCMPGCKSHGGTVLMAGDFHKTGHYDLIIGSVNETNLYYWKNDGTDNFSAQPNIVFSEGAPAAGFVADFNGDGYPDFVISRDGWNCGESGATVWFFANNGDGTFTKRATPIADLGGSGDTDYGAAFNMDNDPDGTVDIFISDGNDSGNYYRILNTKLNIYNLDSIALSTGVDALDSASNAITRVIITSLTQTNVSSPQRTITYYLSNDGGENWELVQANELPPATCTAPVLSTPCPHVFTRHGSQLRWKAILHSNAETLSADEAAYAPGSMSSPEINQLTMKYYSVERRRYTRSGLAYGKYPISGTDREVIFSASYFYPGYEAEVTAYNITDLPAGTTALGSLAQVDNDTLVTKLWDAGTVLAARPSTTRNIFAAYDGSGDGIMDDRLEFSETEVTTPTTSPTLQSLLVVDDATKVAVVRFVRGMKGDGSGDRSWKFFDVGHSTPVFLATPSGDSTYLKNGYDTFKTNMASRPPSVLIGANDGMLHAFDAVTGSERWAIIPNNLLAKTKTQRALDVANNEYYSHKFLVDGKVVLQDVFDGSAWRTIAYVGQARGDGLLNNNYYFAVDVTDITNPQPLWQFTDAKDSLAPAKPVLGQTWSAPVVGQVKVNGSTRYVAFFGSGYDNIGTPYTNVGRSVYAVDAVAGTLLGRWSLADVPYGAATNPSTIQNTLPAGASLVDIDGDGYVDRLYIGDLEGRLWRLDVSASATLSGTPLLIDNWPLSLFFDAGLPSSSDTTRVWAPIITKPAITVMGGKAYLYFGTGGDDLAPGTADDYYYFYGVRDDGTTKYPSDLSSAASEWKLKGSGGHKFWTDPLLVNDAVVYFASLPGIIESVNPCDSASGVSLAYGVAIRSFVDAASGAHQAGEAVLNGVSTLSKVRQGFIMRALASTTWSRPLSSTGAAKNDVILQDFTSPGASGTTEQPPIQRLTDQGVRSSSRKIVILKWREVRY